MSDYELPDWAVPDGPYWDAVREIQRNANEFAAMASMVAEIPSSLTLAIRQTAAAVDDWKSTAPLIEYLNRSRDELLSIVAFTPFARYAEAEAAFLAGLRQMSAAGAMPVAGARVTTSTIPPLTSASIAGENAISPADHQPAPATPETPGARDQQVIPPWLWIVALVTLAFTMSAAQERLPPEAQKTVSDMTTWFFGLLAVYTLIRGGKR